MPSHASPPLSPHGSQRSSDLQELQIDYWVPTYVNVNILSFLKVGGSVLNVKVGLLTRNIHTGCWKWSVFRLYVTVKVVDLGQFLV